jgi:hypothetical protein
MAGRSNKIKFGIVVISDRDFYRIGLNKAVFVIGHGA